MKHSEKIGFLSLPDLDLCSGGLIHLFSPRLKTPQILLFALLTWLPLPVLVSLTHNSEVAKSFLRDWPCHVRLLISIPILLAAEWPIHDRTQRAIRHLEQSMLLDEGDLKNLDRDISRINSIEFSKWLDPAILGLMTALSFFYQPNRSSLTWLELAPMAYAWFQHAALPIFQTLAIRWLIRLMLWAWLLLRIARSRLDLIPFHPDGAGGLTFITWAQRPFAVIAFAFSAVLSANVYQGITYRNLPVEVAYITLGAYYLFASMLFLGPLLPFTLQMAARKGGGLLDFSLLTETYGHQFRKELGTPEEPRSKLANVSISAMTDLTTLNTFAKGMRITLIDRKSLLVFAVASFAPLAPALLSEFGWSPLVSILTKIVS